MEINDNIKLDYLDYEDTAIYDDGFKEEQKVEVEIIKDEVIGMNFIYINHILL